jgi:phenylpropionate dioxygenase-like ring-hydroxylating dioxygenase large terminal subunit
MQATARPEAIRATMEPVRVPNRTGIPEALLTDHWYVAAFGEAVSRAPVRRTILGQPVALYRRGDGTVAALYDRCPHRSYPLSRGEVRGDALVCGYHGFAFAPSGACVSVPGQPNIPRAACVRAYPVVESGPFVWIWMGDPAQADPAAIPDHRWAAAPGWTAFKDSATVACRYGMLIDNLLDLSHETFVHKATIGTPDVAETPIATAVDGLTVNVSRRMHGAECPPFYARSTGITGRIDRSQDIAFTVPAFYVLSVRIAPAGDEGPGCNVKIMYAITPETARTTHDFWVVSRDFATDEEWVTETMARIQDAIVQEDVVALEALEADYPEGRVPEISINIDRGALQARRLIHELARTDSSYGTMIAGPRGSA